MRTTGHAPTRDNAVELIAEVHAGSDLGVGIVVQHIERVIAAKGKESQRGFPPSMAQHAWIVVRAGRCLEMDVRRCRESKDGVNVASASRHQPGGASSDGSF